MREEAEQVVDFILGALIGLATFGGLVLIGATIAFEYEGSTTTLENIKNAVGFFFLAPAPWLGAWAGIWVWQDGRQWLHRRKLRRKKSQSVRTW